MFGAVLGHVDRRDMVAMGALLLAGVGSPLFMSSAAGAIGVPSTDDWIYMRAASGLYRSGTIDVAGHTAAFIGQLVMVQPLLWLSGGNAWAFTAFGLVMMSIGVASTYLLARRFVGIGSAVMVVLLVLASPGWVREAATFMTDVPAFALSMLCLLLGTRWLQGEGSRVTLLLSLGVGVVGLSIREFALAAPAAILVAAWARNRADERVWLAAVSVTLVVLAAGVLAVAASTPGRGTAQLTADPWRLAYLGPAFTTTAAVVLPAAALSVGRRFASIGPQHAILGAALVVFMYVTPNGPLVGQLWMSSGLVGNALLNGSRDPVIGPSAWALSGQLGSFAAILLAALALASGQRRLAGVASLSAMTGRAIGIARSREAPLVLFLVAYAGELAVLLSMSYYPLDRYLYPMVPVVATLLLRGPAQPSRFGRSHAFAHAAFAWLVASAFVIAANSFAYDAARYRGGEAAVAMGYDARTVDAGYEWVGSHGNGLGTGTGSYGLMWYDDEFANGQPCAVLSNSPLVLSSFRLIRVDRSAYLQYLFFGPAEPLYLYGALADGCPPLPTAFAGWAQP